MNNNSWGEEFDNQFPCGLDTEVLGINGDGVDVEKVTDKVKQFISKLISEAEKRGFIDGWNTASPRFKLDEQSGNHSSAKALSDMPKTMAEVMIQGREDEFYRIAKKQAQQEIAESIIGDIPEWMDVEPHNLKDQLRKKYIKKKSIT